MKDFAFDLQRFEHIVNPASNVHVSGTSGSDSIDNTGANVTIEAGAGDDTIRSEIGGTNAAKGSVIIYAGAGNDSIRSDSTNSTLDGGDGDDDILTWGRVTVIGGKGNDGIGLGDDNNYDEHKNLVIYNKGDGNDTIYGFNSDGYNNVGKRLQDTLQVVGADYSTVTSGNDLIVKVDKNFITLKNAAKVPVLIIGNCATADDSITWTFKTVNSTVTATGKIDGKTVATITGLKKGTTASDFSVNGDVITLSKNALTTSKVSITGNYTLALAEDVSTPAALGDGWVVSGTKAYYKTSRTSAGYTLDPNKKSITYTAEKGTNSITVSGLKKDTSAENLSLNEKIVTVSADALTTSNVTISNGYTLALADDVAKPVTTAAGFYVDGTTATYKTLSKTAGYSVAANGKSISYSKAVASKDLTIVTGLKEGVTADDLSMNTSKKIVTLDLNALGTSTVTATNNYTFALASDVPKSKTTSSPYWTFTENKILDKIVMSKTATYTAAGVTEGYVLASNKKSVSYKSASGGETLATITGLSTKATAKNISVKNGVITLAKNALTGNVVLEGDYTLALAKDVKKSATTAAHWEISGTTAKYIATKTTAGYKLSSDKKSVNYVTASGGETLATITGLKKGVKASQLSIDTENKVITLSKNALASSTVKVKGDYTLALADDVAKTEITDGKFVVSGTSAKYVASKVTASYELSEDKKSVLYTAAGTKKTLLTITGLKAGTTAEQLSLNGRTVLLGADITSSKGATVKGADYGFDLTTVGKLVNGGSDASLLGSGGNDTLIGGKGADFISGGNVEDSYDYLSGGAGNDTIQGGYGYHTLLGGDGNDYIVIVTYVYPDGTKPDSADKTGNSYLNGGNGNDTVKGGYGNDTLLGGKGNDYISGGAGDDSLDGGDGNDTLYSGSGKNTLNGGAGNDSIYGTGTLLGGKGNDTLFS